MTRAIIITRRTEDAADNRARVREDGKERETTLSTIHVLSGVNEFITVTTDDGETVDAWYSPNPNAPQEHVANFPATVSPNEAVRATAAKFPGYGICSHD